MKCEDFTLPSSEELNRIWRRLHKDLPDFTFEWSTNMKRTGATIEADKRRIRLSVRLHLQYGMEETVASLRHEAAHWLAWTKNGDRGHGYYFYYWLGFLGGPRYAPRVSSELMRANIKVYQRRTNGIQYDPVSKTFKQIT